MAANVANVLCFPFKLCNKICLGIGDMCRSPFFLYVTVTTCLNVPPVIYSLISLLEHDNTQSKCRGKTWLIINLIFCIINVLASWYLYCKVRKSFGYEDNEFSNRHTAFSRASYVLCYDPIMTFYILVLIGFFTWQCIGIVWILKDSCPDSIMNPFGSSLGFGWAFICIGSCAFCCSLCCAGCDTTEYGYKTQQQHEQTPAIPPSASQPTSIYVQNDHSVVTGLSSPTKTEGPITQPAKIDPTTPYNEIPVAIAVPLPPPSYKDEGEV